jgi:flagellar biosynthesis protein
VSAKRKQRERAVALEYEKNADAAPRVTAKGEGFVAKRIVEIATEANVPIVEDAALVSALLALEIGQEIPGELYEAVARVLAFIYNIDREMRKRP